MSLEQKTTIGMVPGLVVNALIFAMLGYVAFLHVCNPDLYYRSVQEDEVLEWATFWAFILASVIWLWAALRQRHSSGRFPWFLIGIGLFCFVVAMEEISWAQRLFSYRPPAYFLAENFQQELNFHNIVSTDLRELALFTVLFGYGILLPVLAQFLMARRLMDTMGIIAPPLDLSPPFAAALVLSVAYPWEYTNETVELMMAAGFLFAAVASLAQFSSNDSPYLARSRSLGSLVSTVLVIGLSLASVVTARYGDAHDPFTKELAFVESEVLRRDFNEMIGRAGESFPNRKNIHKRIYSYENEFGGGYLYSGYFSGLVEGGMPEERADFFLDPWNSPYWVTLRWDDEGDRLTAFVYSFGPNRRRDSSKTEILGDDIGAYMFQNEVPRRR